MRLPKWFSGVFFGVAALGLFDAAYLAAKHFQGIPPSCSLLEGCEVVTTSVYAVVWGMPVALAGVFYYIAAIVLLALFLELRRKFLLQLLVVLVSGGVLATAWFVFAQIFLLRAACFYCMISAGSSAALFILGMGWLRPSAFQIQRPDVEVE